MPCNQLYRGAELSQERGCCPSSVIFYVFKRFVVSAPRTTTTTQATTTTPTTTTTTAGSYSFDLSSFVVNFFIFSTLFYLLSHARSVSYALHSVILAHDLCMSVCSSVTDMYWDRCRIYITILNYSHQFFSLSNLTKRWTVSHRHTAKSIKSTVDSKFRERIGQNGLLFVPFLP